MAYSKTLQRSQITSQHSLYVRGIKRSELPLHLDDSTERYTTFYAVHNFDADGHIFFYLGKGHEGAPRQVVGWYPKTGDMWSSYGDNIVAAINGMQRDGWLHA